MATILDTFCVSSSNLIQIKCARTYFSIPPQFRWVLWGVLCVFANQGSVNAHPPESKELKNMPPDIRDYLSNADHCERMALEVRNDKMRQMYADLAKQCRELVRQIYKLEQQSAA